MRLFKKGLFLFIVVMAPLFSAGLLGQKKAHDKRVEKALDALGFKYSVDSDGDFKLTFETGKNRSQMVFINSNTSEYREFEIREIWSPVYKIKDGELSGKIAYKLLKDTNRKKIGAWAISGNYAIFVARISADADDDAIKSTLKLVIAAADEMEEEITNGKDLL